MCSGSGCNSRMRRSWSPRRYLTPRKYVSSDGGGRAWAGSDGATCRPSNGISATMLDSASAAIPGCMSNSIGKQCIGRNKIKTLVHQAKKTNVVKPCA